MKLLSDTYIEINFNFITDYEQKYYFLIYDKQQQKLFKKKLYCVVMIEVKQDWVCVLMLCLSRM